MLGLIVRFVVSAIVLMLVNWLYQFRHMSLLQALSAVVIAVLGFLAESIRAQISRRTGVWSALSPRRWSSTWPSFWSRATVAIGAAQRGDHRDCGLFVPTELR